MSGSDPEPEQTGAQLIAAERTRQIEVEGFDPTNDDAYEANELLRAAECYLRASYPIWGGSGRVVPLEWPWEDVWWKPSDDPVRNLTKAGALIAAEIDRRIRYDYRPAEVQT